MSIPPPIFNGWQTAIAPKKAGIIRRGDAVTLTEAAREKAGIPVGQGQGVLVDVWVEDGKAVCLVVCPAKDRKVEAVVGGDDVKKQESVT